MAAKTISQKKWAKLVSSTGPLAQPPGSISRASNLLFTTRGSLQLADGSASIGRLPSPFTSAAAIAVFTKFASGNYPIYCVLATPSGGYALTNPAAFAATPVAGSGNSAGNYVFAIVANLTVGSVTVTSGATAVRIMPGATFSAVSFFWNPVPNATSYTIYYAGHSGGVVGNAILSSIAGAVSGSQLTATFTGTLTTGTTPIPQVNSSGLIQFIIGTVAQPSPSSPSVSFTAIASGPLLAQFPQPAQLLPGDPSFVFDPVNTNQETLYPASSGGTASAVANASNPSTTQTTLVASGWAPSSTVSGQQITVYVPVSGGNSVGAGTSGGGAINYEYSTDAGSTWTSFSSFPATVASWGLTLSFSVSASTLTDLSNLQIRIVATAAWGYGPGTVQVSGSVTNGGVYISTSTSTSFSPYGGVPGQVNVIPQLVQFAGLEILILGNGYAPQGCDPTLVASATLTPLNNTFQAAYPAWQPSVDWVTGSQVTDGAGNFYTATQGGVSQTPGPPAWAATKGAETADGSVIWTSQGPLVSIIAPRGAAHAVAYAGSLWLANTYPNITSDGIDGPTCLKMSDANNPNSWNPVNTAFIGRDDGTQITGLQPFTIAALGISPTGSLCVFKEFTTYQVIGVFGSASFEIQPAQTNLGCLAARSIQFLPGFGVCRFAHLGFAVFDGINDRLVSEDIRPYLFGGVDSEADLVPVDPTYLYLSQSAQTTSPPTYLCAMPLVGNGGALTRLFCYDLVMKSWAVIDLPWAITALSTSSAGEGYPLVLCCRSSDGSIQRMQSGDVNWDNGGTAQSNVAWAFRSPDIFGEGSSQRLFVEMVTIRGYGNAAMVASIFANLWLDGKNIGAQGIDVVPQAGGNLFEARVKIFLNGYRAHLDLSGNGGGAAATIDSLDWSVVPKSALARRIIS